MMDGKRRGVTLLLAWSGTILAGLPILLMVVTSAIYTATRGEFRMDILIPAELFPLELIGGVLILWAAVRAGESWKPSAWAMGVMVALLAGAQGAAVLTGLAHGDAEPVGWRIVLVFTLLGGFLIAIIWLVARGVQQLRRLKKKS